jgi:DNA invertase Pin-like site-specific DNA recombinase
MKAGNLVAYYRVSTTKQGESGLGLDAQKATVRAYAERTGSEVIAEYQEVESGRKKRRPALQAALGHAQMARATLIIAKFDRLARNVHFLSGLMESGIEFIACDLPDANRFTLHIMAAVAEQEAQRISENTTAALAAYKARGGLLGAHRPECQGLSSKAAQEGRQVGSEAVRDDARVAYRFVAPRIAELRATGMTLQAIADRFNSEGMKTRKGARWSAVQVMRVLERYSNRPTLQIA